MLYTFERLATFLTQGGYPDANQRGVQIIRRDLTQEEQAGNLDFRDDGIYLKVNGQEYKGYMYLKYPNVARFGLPKFHITNCKTILEQRTTGRFDGRYFWHNSKTVTIEDRANGQVHEHVNLSLCGNCERQSSIDEYSDTEGFFSLLDQQEVEETTREIQLDIFGRPLEWDNISKEYRKEQSYTCENCGFGGEMLESRKDREFIHTDHIVAWELANMRRNNLQCLCILCHSQKDDVHKTNFSKPGMKKRIQRFLYKYRAKLIELENEYIDSI
jgi:hypothetical protein